MNIFVTGISSGIGREITIQLIKSGHRVWGIARSESGLQDLRSSLPSDKLRVTACDVTNLESCRAVATQMSRQNFLPDVVVLNAAIYAIDVADTFDFDAFEKNLSTNLSGALFWVRIFMPMMRQRQAGHFIAISSTSALRPGYTSVGYPASKAALSMAFRGLRLNFKESPIKFSIVHFGPVDTGLWTGKLSFLVPSAKAAATFAISVMKRESGSFFYPFLSTLLLRCSLFLPDVWFAQATKIMKKKRE